MAIDTKALYLEVASEALDAMNASMREFPANNPEDGDEYCETNLYVFANGSWAIDHAQFIQTTNGCVSCVPIGFYATAVELAEDIRVNEDWDAIEDAESEDED